MPFIGSAPTSVAIDQGYFKDEGLDIQLKLNTGGWLSLKDLFEGKADFATVAELPVVYSAYDKRKYTKTDRPDFYVIGDMIYSQNIIQRVVYRKDRGISSPADLKGKRIGVFLGTTLDFFMDAFFVENNIAETDVEIVNLDVFKMTDAIAAGDLDAIFSWEPHVQIALDRLDGNGATLNSDLQYSTAWLIVVTKEYAKSHPMIMRKFLRAIVKAQNFIKKHPQESIEIHARMTNVDKGIIRRLWDLVDFDLSLSESLLTVMEDEAEWIFRKQLYNASEIPDMKVLIHDAPLRDVHPGGVRLIR